MLAKFRAAKQSELAALRKAAEAGALPPPLPGERKPFRAALTNASRIAVIAEYKRASPSLGVIRSDLDVADVAGDYQAAGAVAMSVLTEEKYFDGRLDYLARADSVSSLPLLRKDFIFDPLQIAATAATPAAAILLIARMLADSRELRNLIEAAQKRGLAPVVEIFDAADLKLAREAGAEIIQVNARDLDRLQVDRAKSLRLISEGRPESHELWITASGIKKPEHLAEAASAGFQAALVGGFLMAEGSPKANLAGLLEGLRCF